MNTSYFTSKTWFGLNSKAAVPTRKTVKKSLHLKKVEVEKTIKDLLVGKKFIDPRSLDICCKWKLCSINITHNTRFSIEVNGIVLCQTWQWIYHSWDGWTACGRFSHLGSAAVSLCGTGNWHCQNNELSMKIIRGTVCFYSTPLLCWPQSPADSS